MHLYRWIARKRCGQRGRFFTAGRFGKTARAAADGDLPLGRPLDKTREYSLGYS
ncbi:MAG: hypothetical protein LBG87_05285 [Spirochaetaceae bacterium]|nr:hypothetical protein [Spirochaetaceae bacterium]